MTHRPPAEGRKWQRAEEEPLFRHPALPFHRCPEAQDDPNTFCRRSEENINQVKSKAGQEGPLRSPELHPTEAARSTPFSCTPTPLRGADTERWPRAEFSDPLVLCHVECSAHYVTGLFLAVPLLEHPPPPPTRGEVEKEGRDTGA